MLSWVGSRAQRWAAEATPWTNVYGLARTILALGTAGTLLFSHSADLFRPGSGAPVVPQCGGLRQAALFCVMPEGRLEIARWLAIVCLFVVASGWRPRWTGLVHWWITFSFSASALVLDGGDQVALVLSLLLVPVTLTDPRRWHWDELPSAIERSDARWLIARSALLMVRLQMAGLYLHASLGKLKVEEWADGTALYYWLSDELLGVPAWLRAMLHPLLSSPAVAVMTWGVLVFEFVLFMAIVFDNPARERLLKLGIVFHASIAVAFGLTSFFASMGAGLILFLRPLDHSFNVRWIRSRCAALVRRLARRRLSTEAEHGERAAIVGGHGDGLRARAKA